MFTFKLLNKIRTTKVIGRWRQAINPTGTLTGQAIYINGTFPGQPV
jgi:hypothetical protein